jgi:hypothetical protein
MSRVPSRRPAASGDVYIGVRAIGVMWLLTGAAFAVLAIAVGLDASWWYRGVLLTAAVSTTGCVVEWPQPRAGVLMNAVVLATAVASHGLADV